MPRFATEDDFNALANTRTEASNSVSAMISEAQDEAFNLGFIQGQRFEGQRIIALLSSRIDPEVMDAEEMREAIELT